MDLTESLERTPLPSQTPDVLPGQSEGFDLAEWDQRYQDLMLVAWLCMDFRQKLLNVLYTSCQSHFHEARNLAKEKLLELLECMAAPDTSIYTPPSTDFHYHPTPLPNLPPTPDRSHGSCPSTIAARQDTSEEELMCMQDGIHPTRGSQEPEVHEPLSGQQVLGTPEPTFAATRQQQSSPNAQDPGNPSKAVPELPLCCSDFVNFDLLSDGEVFSISTFAADSFDYSEMELDPVFDSIPTNAITPPTSQPSPETPSSCRVDSPPNATRAVITPSPNRTPPAATPGQPGHENDVVDMEANPPALSRETRHSNSSLPQPSFSPGHTTSSHPAPLPSTTPRSRATAPLSNQEPQALPVPSPTTTPPPHSHHKTSRKRNRYSTYTTCQRTSTPAACPISPITTDSPSWTHSIPNYLPPPATVLATFTKHLGEEKLPTAQLLTRLFYAIGSPDALSQLRHAVKLSRENTPVTPISHTNDLATTVQALDHLDSLTSLSHILRRYYLVRLLEHRTRLEQDHITAKQAWRRPKRMLKYDCARVELIKSGGNVVSEQRERERDCRPKYRTKTQALTDLMQMLYPDLKPVAGGSKNCVYSRKLMKLRNRLSCARNWYKFEQAFPGGILALIPCAGRFGISIDQIEKLPSDTVQMFLDYLQEHRGDFLRRISEALDVFGGLTRADGTGVWAFEELDEDSFGDLLYDSDDLIDLCKRV